LLGYLEEEAELFDFDGAIAERKLIMFTYNGLPRVVIPAAYGPHITTGNESLRGYQVGGEGSSRSVPFWDLFTIAKMVNVELEGSTFFDLPPQYKKDDKAIRPIRGQL
jgi:hypothetical protein